MKMGLIGPYRKKTHFPTQAGHNALMLCGLKWSPSRIWTSAKSRVTCPKCKKILEEKGELISTNLGDIKKE